MGTYSLQRLALLNDTYKTTMSHTNRSESPNNTSATHPHRSRIRQFFSAKKKSLIETLKCGHCITATNFEDPVRNTADSPKTHSKTTTAPQKVSVTKKESADSPKS